MMALWLAVGVALSILSSGSWVNAQANDIPIETVVCNLNASVPGWLDIAAESRDLAQRATGEPAIVFAALHDSMKGSADIVNAISNVIALSREGLYQLNQNCIAAPLQVEQVVISISVHYPDFGKQFKRQLDGIQNRAENLSHAIAKC